MRIVSLIPEATEVLRAIGLGDDVVAVSKEETWNSGFLWVADTRLIFTSETGVGDSLPRHLVRRVVGQMRRKPRPSVYALEPRSVGEILSDVKTIGDAVGRQSAARTLIEGLRARIDAVSLRSARALADGVPPRVVCLSSVEPPTAAGWWLAELVGLAGGLDALDGLGRPPHPVTWEQIDAARPDLVVRAEDLGAVQPGPGAVDLLERLAALIVRGR